MAAYLENTSALQIQYKFLWRGVFRYINEGMNPVTNTNVWVPNDVMTELQTQLLATTLFDSWMHEDCTLVEVKGRVRGDHPNVLQTITKPLNIVGGRTGAPTPSWLTCNIFQIPDNTNRYIISGTPTPFKPGRMAMPGIPADAIDGEYLQSDDLAGWVVIAQLMSAISEGANPTNAPAFEAVLTRLASTAPYAPVQRANVLEYVGGRIGHQDTARE